MRPDFLEQRWLLMQKMVPSVIEAKLVYLDFLRSLPPEQIQAIRSNVYEQFDEKQLPELVKSAKMKSPAEFDSRLRSFGSSLDNTRRLFFEQVAAREMIRRQTESDKEITHEDVDKLVKLNEKIGMNIAGEGGEFETLMVDGPIFKKRIIIIDSEIEIEKNHIAYFHIKEAKLESK